MGTRKTNGALEGHVDVKDAYRMAQDDIRTLLRLIAQETRMHASTRRRAGCTSATSETWEPRAGPWSRSWRSSRSRTSSSSGSAWPKCAKTKVTHERKGDGTHAALEGEGSHDAAAPALEGILRPAGRAGRLQLQGGRAPAWRRPCGSAQAETSRPFAVKILKAMGMDVAAVARVLRRERRALRLRDSVQRRRIRRPPFRPPARWAGMAAGNGRRQRTAAVPAKTTQAHFGRTCYEAGEREGWARRTRWRSGRTRSR